MIKSITFYGKLISTLIVASLILACGPVQPPEEESEIAVKQKPPTPTPKRIGKDTAYFLNRMASPRELAIPHPKETMVLRSSHNPREPEDGDVFHGKYEIDGEIWKTVLDENGPGCIARMWFSGNAKGRLRIYFDHEDQPRVDTTIEDFYHGEYKDYLKKMLVFPENRSGHGYISYFPMPFAQHCTVMISGDTPNLKYQFNILKYEQTEKLVSFRPELDESAKKAYENTNQFMSYLASYRFQDQPITSLDKITIPANSRKMLANISGPAGLDYFVLNVNPLTNDTLSGVKMQIYWDSLSQPAVSCTLSEFFGHAQNNVLPKDRWTSLYLGYLQDQNMLYSQFYMPFEKKAQIFLENQTETDIQVKLAYHVDLENSPEEFMYFYARSSRRDVQFGFLYPFIEFEGKGNFVGLNVRARSGQSADPFFFMEGDELVYINGENEPSIMGTGLDNYFNGDNRFGNTAYFITPLYGSMWKDASEGRGEINSYRFHTLDAIQFDNSIMYLQEVGCPIQYSQMEDLNQGHFSWTCYFYGIFAEKKVPRNENLFYFTLNHQEQGEPSVHSPLMRQGTVNMKVPPGRWWVHYAPIQNLGRVQHRLLREK